MQTYREDIFNHLPIWEKLAKKMIWQQIGSVEHQRVLDFGSGEGFTADYYAANNQVVAVEPSQEMLAQRYHTNSYRQIIGSTDALKEFEDETFDLILCHNVLEYADDREEIIRELARLLRSNGRLSVVKHNRNGRVMQMVVLLNNFQEANRLLDGYDSHAAKFGAIRYYDDKDIMNWCPQLSLVKTFGLRTFWDLQQNQEIQKDDVWQKQMLEIETRAAENSDFHTIAFFHHLIFTKA